MARTAAKRSPPGTAEVLESFDPATGELVGTVPVTPPEEVERVAEEVARIQRGWALVPLPERLRVIHRAGQVLLRRRDEIAMAVTRENGKPLVESGIVEVANGVATLDWIAKWGSRYLSPERLPDPQPLIKHKRHWIVYRPLGVVGVIAPWNYPLIIPLGEVAQGLAAGNGVVLKPSEVTPLAGEQIARLFAEAGLPKGLVRVIHGRGETGAALCAAGPVRKIFFTGSVETGRKVMRAAAEHGKPVMLELGGKDPAIVCADADIDRTVAGVLWSGLCNSGQTCAGVERIYVDRRIHDRFVDRLAAEARKIASGDPKDPSTQVGPMNNDMQYAKVLEQLEDAVAKGAAVVTGGPIEVDGLPGKFIAPTVLARVDHSMRVMAEESFGPLLPVMAFDDEDEAVRLANDSRYGLGSSVWSRDLRRARRIADRLEAGMVWINDATYSHGIGQTPWGGVKESGTGVTHSKFGFYEMVDKQLVSEDPGWFPDGWWYPYGEAMRRGFGAVIDLLYTPGVAGRSRVLRDRWGEMAPFVRGVLARRSRR
ncbi:MAG TPA: aldehyde dehydrogenase family protein [Actinomycetota bacterium]|nr:aldehyde dehydrogenase family protein [Actinomycetota bacterium]